MPAPTLVGADSEPSTASLVAGMANDAKRLGEAYFELGKLELGQSLRKAAYLLLGAAVLAVGALFLLFGVTFVLVDIDAFSRGEALALVGGSVCAAGVAWLCVAHARTAQQGRSR